MFVAIGGTLTCPPKYFPAKRDRMKSSNDQIEPDVQTGHQGTAEKIEMRGLWWQVGSRKKLVGKDLDELC